MTIHGRQITDGVVSHYVEGYNFDWLELLFAPPNSSLSTASDPGSASALPPSSWVMLLYPSLRDCCLLK